MNALAKNLLAVLLLAVVVLYFGGNFPRMQKGVDFSDFYAAARMVRDGRGAQLYDRSTQDAYLARYSGRVGTYFIHPPFEALVYLPFSLLPLPSAYMLWCAFNALLLLMVTILLTHHLRLRGSWQVLLVISLLFPPLLLDFLQGQDSLPLLFLFSAAFVAMQQKRDVGAGCLLACGLIKFHLTIPLALLMMFSASRKMWRGFAAVALGLLLLSLGISGRSAISTYSRFLYHLSGLPLGGIHYQAMANLRGLWRIMLPRWPNLSLWLTVITSLIVFGLTVNATMLAAKSGARKLAWGIAILAATLVSYHLSPHDLTILLLPLALILDHIQTEQRVPKPTQILFLLTSGLLLLPPLHLLLLALHDYAPIAVFILLLYALMYFEIRRVSALRAVPELGANL